MNYDLVSQLELQQLILIVLICKMNSVKPEDEAQPRVV